MNSSTLTSESNPSCDRWRLWLFLIVFFGFLGVAVVVVAWFDPYDWLGRRGYVAAAPRSGVDQMMGKVISLNNILPDERKRVDVVVIGDSRARLLTTATKSNTDGHLIVNGGVGGLSIEESLTFLEYQVPRFPSVKRVVLLAPFERLSQASTPNRIHDVIQIADSLPGYLLNWEHLKMSLSAWRYSPVPRGYDGGVLNVAVPRTPDQVALDLSREQFRAYDAHLADRRIAALAETVNLLRDRGLQVMLWMPPLRQDVQSYFAEFRLEAEKDRLAASLRKIAPLVDSVLEPGIGNIRFVFIDPVHTDNGPAILAELLRSTSR